MTALRLNERLADPPNRAPIHAALEGSKRSGFKPATLIILLVFALTIISAKADAVWTAWKDIGEKISVSFTQVNKSTWTWKFRNDGETTVTYMDFNYTDTKGTHPDVFPGTLAPHKAFGGWAAFTAESKPEIKIKKITRKEK